MWLRKAHMDSKTSHSLLINIIKIKECIKTRTRNINFMLGKDPKNRRVP